MADRLTTRRRRGERGGAVSLWVLLMVPVSAFAAVVAMAVPQRLAAESSVQEAADDLAMFAVAWRDGHQLPAGALPAFFEHCDQRSEAHITEIDGLTAAYQSALNAPGASPTDPAVVAAKDALDDRVVEIDKWSTNCERLFEALLRDLGYLGVDMGSLQGLYSDSLTQSAMTGTCPANPALTTQAACTGAGHPWTASPQFAVPCRTTEATGGRQAMVVRDAVYVALAARWQDAGWAAAQVWPDGLPMAGGSLGRLSQRDPVATPPMCENQLVVTDSQGRPMASGDGPDLVRDVPRTALSG